ncbi:hypothetical protein CVT26_007751 [Gymnopilus dilepis]|uniref:F-box domain-containing protein n=1 Tax=Gymnopilus dilepis TaxID=231916 RepID=A0A409WSE5_9AGAR|nr:hypothetical protein CVT26_007751 [Gymnopilus dilepis]
MPKLPNEIIREVLNLLTGDKATLIQCVTLSKEWSEIAYSLASKTIEIKQGRHVDVNQMITKLARAAVKIGMHNKELTIYTNGIELTSDSVATIFGAIYDAQKLEKLTLRGYYYDAEAEHVFRNSTLERLIGMRCIKHIILDSIPLDARILLGPRDLETLIIEGCRPVGPVNFHNLCPPGGYIFRASKPCLRNELKPIAGLSASATAQEQMISNLLEVKGSTMTFLKLGLFNATIEWLPCIEEIQLNFEDFKSLETSIDIEKFFSAEKTSTLKKVGLTFILQVWSLDQLRRLNGDKNRKLRLDKIFRQHLYPNLYECTIGLTVHASFRSQEVDDFDIQHYLERALGDRPNHTSLYNDNCWEGADFVDYIFLAHPLPLLVLLIKKDSFFLQLARKLVPTKSRRTPPLGSDLSSSDFEETREAEQRERKRQRHGAAVESTEDDDDASELVAEAVDSSPLKKKRRH